MIHRKSKKELEVLKESGRILAIILGELKSRIAPGVRLSELDMLARKKAKEFDAHPSFLGYQPEGSSKPYPAALCASLNDTIVHGLPTDYALRDGDVLSIDMGITYKGLITDAAFTVAVGKVPPAARALITSTKKALEEAITTAKLGKTLGDIGWAIERRAHKDGLKVIKNLTGHGVGYELHEDPVVLNFGRKGMGPDLTDGMVLAIEPMLSLSSERAIRHKDDSYVTADGSLAAHFEHTVAITKNGTVILTAH
jgi:methionyl aminopeptidase